MAKARSLALPFAAPPAVPPDVVAHGDSLAFATAHAGADLGLVYIDPPFGTGRIQRGQAGHQIQWLHHNVGGAIPIRRLQGVAHLS